MYDELINKLNAIQTTDTSTLVKKMTMTQKQVKLERKYLNIIMMNVLLLMNLIN